MDSCSYWPVCRSNAICLLLVRSGSSTISALAWIGFAVAIMTAATFGILQAVDGIALKMAVDSWLAAPVDEKPIIFSVAEGIRWIEYGTNSIFRILQGTVAIIFGVVIVKSMSQQMDRRGWSCYRHHHYRCWCRGCLCGFCI